MTEFQIVCAVLIGILSVSRTARLIIWDEFPPMQWIRLKWFVAVGESDWGKLLGCQFCLTPYLSAGMLAWFWFSDGHWTWWVINGVWAGSYLAASYVAYDQPDD